MWEPKVVGGSLRERQRLQVRADIQRAASRLFAEHGFHAVTTEAVASAAGVSHSTFFRHVRHKEDLLLSSVRASGPAIVATLARRGAECPARDHRAGTPRDHQGVELMQAERGSSHDVIVGSGGGALTAAAPAAGAGLRMVVLEATELIGGTGTSRRRTSTRWP